MWATWCGPCIAEFDELVEHNLRFRIRPFEMVTIAAEYPDQEATVKDFLTKKHASMKNYILASDNKDELYEALDPATGRASCRTRSSSTRRAKWCTASMAHRRFLKMRRAIVPELNRIKPWGGSEPHQAVTARPRTLPIEMGTFLIS